MDTGIKDSRASDRHHQPTKKQVMTDPLMRKGHVHNSTPKGGRSNTRARLHMIDLDHLDEADEFDDHERF